MSKRNPPLYEVSPIETVRDILDQAAAQAPDTIAFRFKRNGAVVDRTYRQFLSDVRALGTALTRAGLCGGHIACIGENRYEWVCTYLTALCGDGVFLPLDRELPEADLLTVLQEGDADVLFYAGSFETFVTSHRNELPRIRRFIGFDREEDSEDGVFLSYASFLEAGRAAREAGDLSYDAAVSDPSALKLLVYTSGTTGRAKGVMLSEHNLVSCVYYGLQVSTVYDCCLSVLPYHHTYEAVAGLLVSLHKHATVCINDKIRNVVKNLQLFCPSYVYLVPAFAESFYKKIWQTVREKGKEKAFRHLIATARALRAVGIDPRDGFFSSIHEMFGGRLKKIVCGGAPLRPEIAQFFDDIGIPLISGYGITECSPLVSVNRDTFNDWRTAGVLLPCLEAKIENTDEEGNGEICVRGDTVMLGYYKNPEETARVLRDGWFATGDYGHINTKRQVTVTGRKKNLIVLNNGKNIYPEEIEEHITAIPYVAEAVVFPLRDEAGGEYALGVEIFPDEAVMAERGIDDPAASLKTDVAQALRGLPSYKQISRIRIRREPFDKTTTNKIKRQGIGE